MLLGQAGLGFHESLPPESMSRIQGAVPKEQLFARNPTHYLALSGKLCSFLGLALSSSPARQAPDAASPEPTWLDLGPCAAGVQHLGSRCARVPGASLMCRPGWRAGTRVLPSGSLCSSNGPAQPDMLNSKAIAVFRATVMQTM